MRLRLLPSSPHITQVRTRGTQRGIALVITLILLSVILVVTFALLAVSRRERSSVTTSQQQVDAEYMSTTAFERAKATLAAQILSRTNINAGGIVEPRYDVPPAQLRVGGTHLVTTSTNSTDVDDFTPSYIASLQHDARVPVFIKTNNGNNNQPLDFRHYLDFNRNGQFESNGFHRLLDVNGNVVSDYAKLRFFTAGDPEWLGVLDRPGLPHSASNRFVGRYAYMVVPAGRVLDLNTIHNNAGMERDMLLKDGYSRNQGVGTFEINLAAFLADLNTNQWGRARYQYDLANPLGTGTGIGPGAASGIAFDDARSMLMYRYGGNYQTLPRLADLFGVRGVEAFGSDFIDNYANDSEFEMRQGLSYVRRENESTAEPADFRWPGGENTNQFVLPNGFFNTNLIKRYSPNYPAFINRLQTASRQKDSYNRYTFYRLLSQMGTDTSSLETDNRIHLNWRNTDGFKATNFVAWTPTLFFSNVADRLIREAYPNTGFSITNIPIYPTNYYTPVMHRLLQVAANLYEANTNRFAATNPRYPSHAAYLPTIFRPIFESQGGFVRIAGYEEYDPATTESLLVGTATWRTFAQVRANGGSINRNENLMGIPPVVAVRKGYPSLNEISLGSMVELTRRLQVRKTNPRDNLSTVKGITNEVYSLAISNSLGFEAWNGYTNPYPRNLQVWVAGRLAMTLTDRDDTYNSTTNPPPILTNTVAYGSFTAPVMTVPANSWAGGIVNNYPVAKGFMLPIYTNFILLPGQIYDPIARNFIPTNSARTYVPPEGFFSNPWVLRTTNEFVYVLYDTDARRVVDVATMNRLETHVDVIKELNGNISASGSQISQLWRTNKLRGSVDPKAITLGAWHQMQIAIGDTVPGPGETPWRALTIGGQSALQKEIDNFRDFLRPPTGGFSTATPTALWKQAPYVPTARLQVKNSWQANDPLLHYMPEHMSVLKATKDGRLPQGSRVMTNIFEAVIVPNNPAETSSRLQFNLGKMNDSYYAWRGSPTKPEDVTFPDIGRQDPGVVSPDNWEFPTNAYPSVGWIGRVHRGTPWQTIYLKAYDPRWDVADGRVIHFNGAEYRSYSEALGKPIASESGGATGEPPTLPLHWNAHPTNDWLLVDLFTTASNDRATLGALGVNQSGLAAWSAVLSGITVLSNHLAYQATNLVIQPAFEDTNSPLIRIVNGINRTRAGYLSGTFASGGDILRVPELTVFSPYIRNTNTVTFISEEVYEQIPRQIMSLVRKDDPRFVVYAYGQSLLPAQNGLVVDPTSPQYGLCTNYQIMAESATRTVLRFDPRVVNNRLQLTPVVERFNQLPPE